MDIDSSDNINLVSLSSITAGAPYISIKTDGEGSPFVGMILGADNGQLHLQGGQDILCEATTDIDLQAQTGNITLTTAVGDVNVTSGDDITIDSGDNITIDSGDTIVIEAETDLTLDAGDELNIDAIGVVTVDANNLEVKCDAGIQGSMQILGNSTSTNQCVLDVRVSAYADSSSSYWIKFTDNIGNRKGGVQYTPDQGDMANHGYAFISYLSNGALAAANSTSTDNQYAPEGSARFVSGAADFGEYFEAGSYSEWPEATGDDSNILGIPEGLTVWVREGKFYREMISEKCIPMLVTKRSIVTGDASEILKEESSSKGAILSFCGKLPVLIEGAAEAGDYVVPVDNHNHCIAINFEDISFSQYKKAVGRVLYSSKSHGGEAVRFSLVMCAVGIK